MSHVASSHSLHCAAVSQSPRRDADLPLGVSVQRHPQGGVLTIVLHRPAQHNAVDGDTARALFKAFQEAEVSE